MYKRPFIIAILYLQACPILLFLSMDVTQDAALVREIVQSANVDNYINYASLAILVYDMSMPHIYTPTCLTVN